MLPMIIKSDRTGNEYIVKYWIDWIDNAHAKVYKKEVVTIKFWKWSFTKTILKCLWSGENTMHDIHRAYPENIISWYKRAVDEYEEYNKAWNKFNQGTK